MKKLSTILMALLMVAGVNAAPDFQQMMQQNNSSFELTHKVGSVSNFQMSQADLTETCNSLVISYDYTESNNVVFVVMYSQNYMYKFAINGKNFELGKKYTLADMNGEYTGVFSLDGKNGVVFKSVESLTVTEDANHLKHAAAKGVVEQDGDLNVTVTYDEVAYDITCTNLQISDKYVKEYNLMAVVLQGDGLYYAFYIKGDEVTFGKTYTYADMDHENTRIIKDNNTTYTVSDAEIVVTKDEKGKYHVTAKMVSGAAHFRLSYVDRDPVVLHENCTDMVISDVNLAKFGLMTVSLTGKQYNYLFFVKSNKIEMGHTYVFSEMDKQSYATDGENSFKYSDATFTITEDAKKLKHLVGKIITGIDTVYLTYDEPEKPTEYTNVNISVPQASISDGRSLSDPYFQFYGFSADSAYQFQVDFTPKEGITGSYDAAAINVGFCIANQKKNGEYTAIKIVEIKDLVITSTETGYQAVAKFYCMDGNCYNVTFVFTTPVAKTKVNFTADNLDIQDVTAGEFSIMASDAEYTLLLDFFCKDKKAGKYTISDLYMKYCALVDKQNHYYQFYSMDITVAEDNGVYTVTGTILTYDNVEFTLNLTQPVQAVDAVELNSVSNKRIENGQLIILRDGVRYNAMGQIVE